ncbi:uncharacterized protein LOC116289885 [Actinia tenebrosa]|uniref:Uncharacterized protein LOC116289885 n=1 Tax=Actinia tenebrosa TaxID=6105 RepID=A0A6P8HJB3_ACTTE|nr:uncharacterized protein LOC116289885 [Actinia tenebrosa]
MLNNIFTCLSLLLFVIIYSTVAEFNLNHLDTPLLQTRNFETAIDNKALNSSLVFLSVNVSNEDECILKCLMYQGCFSYNLGPKEGERLVCEVCSKVHFAEMFYLVTKTGYKHRSVVSGCTSSPCPAGDICVPRLQTTSSYQCWKPYIDIELKAYGTDDPLGPNHNIFLDSYFKVNGHKYPLSQTGARGHSFRLVTFNGTAIVGPRVTFDSHADSGAASKMVSYISTIPANSIVLVLVADTGNQYYDSNAFLSIGATTPTIEYRTAWTFIGFKGERKSWIVEKKTARYAGPASVTTQIPFTDFV